MNVLITGATGFIGRALTAHLAWLGHDITAVSRDPARASALLRVRACAWDALPATDAIIHLAGESVAGIWTPWKRRRILESRVNTTRQLAAHPARVFLSASAVGYYGDRPGEVLTESSPPDPANRFRAQVCRAWEDATGCAQGRVVQLRLGHVLALDGGYIGALLPLFRIGAGCIFGNAAARVSWITICDTVRLIGFALENDRFSGPLNITTPNSISQSELARGIAAHCNRRVLTRIPAWLLRACLGEAAQALIEDQNIRPAKALDAGFRFEFPAWNGVREIIFVGGSQHTPNRATT